MTLKTLAAAALGGTAALALSTAAFAQAAAPAAAAAAAPTGPTTHGAPPPGVCVFNAQQAVATSTVGRFVQTRLTQISGVVNSELNTERTAIETEDKAISAAQGQAGASADALEKRASDLQVRANAWQRKAQLRQRELEATQQKAIARVGSELDPLLVAAYQQKQCSLLLDRGATIFFAPAMDITPAVVTALNAKITQFTFDRERLDTVPAAAPAAAR